MSSLQTVQAKRDHLVSKLAEGSREKYEYLLDHLLSWNVLNWEDYAAVSLVSSPLSNLVRHLLDVITCKGETDCKHFLDAFRKVENASHEDEVCLQVPEDVSHPCQYLQSQRPRVVRLLCNYISAISQQLVERGYVSKFEIEEIQLLIFSSPQKARRLLDLIRLKGNDPAHYLIAFLRSVEQGGAAQVADVCLAYQKKLKSTVSAQTKFLSTYDGSENMCLEDIYTENVLEIPKTSNMSEHIQGFQNQGLLDIFNSQGLVNEEADTVLILGHAGSGKSTLLQQIQHLWAEGRAFKKFSFIFPFSCRRLCCIDKPISLKSLLFEQCCWPSEQLQDGIFQFILDNPGQVLITFDGFDEFKFAFTDHIKHCSPIESTNVASIVFNLIQGNLLKDCIKVVTSRPDTVTADLRKYVKKEFHLKGFSEDGIEFFMKKHHPNTSDDIVSLVKANSSLHGLCQIPVFCWIVSKCHKQLIECGDKTPQTMTDMYFLTLKHFLIHSSPNSSLKKNILSERLNSIRHLGKISFSGLCQGMYVFSDQDLANADVTEEDKSLGFLVFSKNFANEQLISTQYYEFLHITFQCFFAALYIALSDDVDSTSLYQLFKWNRKSTRESLVQRLLPCLLGGRPNNPIIQNMEIRNLQITATFVSGQFSSVLYDTLLDSWKSEKLPRKCKTIKRYLARGIQKHFKSIPPAVRDEKKSMHAMPEFVWLIKCIYEMQNVPLSKRAVEGLVVDHLKMTYCGIGPTECTALAYVLKHLKNPVGIQLDHNSVGDIGIEQLIPCLHKCHALYLRDNNISDKGLGCLMKHALQWPHFQKIALGNNFINEVGGQILARGLSENKSIQYLGLWGNQVGDLGAKAIADVLQNNKSLVWLSLVGNNIGSVGGQALAGMLEKNTVLEELWFDENKLQDSDAISLAESLKINRTLKVLKLSNNNFSYLGVSALADTLKYNSIITEVWLKGTNLTSDEMETFDKFDHLFVKG
ncbi:nucleotide-binding oligomerization domain-containing protein 2 isoform X2 [Pseudophryne corroboree]|uniref:nucleotide-binding oligomerization domain-containing protein 2 isoform X2 n=1 Tax=Pseudophryne corroboree TaxID=495146 RepID=UPI003081A32A